MAATKEVRFSLKLMINKESNKVIYAEVDSDFADVLLSFLTLPLGTIVRLLIKHYGNDAPILGSLNSLYAGLLNLDGSHFWSETGKLMLLNPRNSSGIQCSGLKLQIDDTPPIQYFTCQKKKCVSLYYEAICCCSDSTNTDITRDALGIEAQIPYDSVFTKWRASFVLSDDLQIAFNSPVSIFRILKLNGIQDTNVLEERTLSVGSKEIMELLKRSLVSKTPITDIFHSTGFAVAALFERMKVFARAKYESDALPRTQTSKNKSSNSKKITVKALVQESTKKVLLAQTRQDFIDFLFSLLTIPLGRVQSLLGYNTCLGSINNLYRSMLNSLEIKEYMKSRDTITIFLEPQLPPYYLSSCQIFSVCEQSSPSLRRRYLDNTIFVSNPSEIGDEIKMIDPKGQGSFVKGPALFIVTDDLVVSTAASSSIISTLNQMKIPISDIEELELDIGLQEALSILQASLTSTNALTNGLQPFIK